MLSIRQRTACLESMPWEIIQLILSYVDLPSINNVEEACNMVKHLLDRSVAFWKKKILTFIQWEKYPSTFLQLTSYDQIMTDPLELRRFYTCLMHMQASFKGNNNADHVVTRSIDCTKVEIDGKTVDVSNQHMVRNRTRGVYDICLDRDRICCSVYDTLQIWDLKTLTFTGMLSPWSLDQGGMKTTCYTLWFNYILCGGSQGHIKIFRIATEECVAACKITDNYISDVIRAPDDDEIAFTIDSRGNITEWKITKNYDARTQKEAVDLQMLSTSGDIPDGPWYVPRILRINRYDRCLAVNSDWLLASLDCHIAIYNRHTKQFQTSLAQKGNILCMDLVKRFHPTPCTLVGIGMRPWIMPDDPDQPMTTVAILCITANMPVKRVYLTFDRKGHEDYELDCIGAVTSLTFGGPDVLFLVDRTSEILAVSIHGLRFDKHDRVVRPKPMRAVAAADAAPICRVVPKKAEEAQKKEETAPEEVGFQPWDHGHEVRLISKIHTSDFGTIVWALRWDGYRLFSGSTEGKVIVHDFLRFDKPLLQSDEAEKDGEYSSGQFENTTTADEITSDPVENNTNLAENAAHSVENISHPVRISSMSVQIIKRPAEITSKSNENTTNPSENVSNPGEKPI